MKFILTLLSVLISICLLLSCMQSKEEQKKDRLELLPEPDKALREEYEKQKALSNNTLIENMRFDFSAKRINTYGETIEVDATLFNDNTDTVYFLSSTCSGDEYLLRYDTSRFRLTPRITCNASYPQIMKIEPHGQYTFSAHFGYNSKETNMKLGFDFISVSKSFDLTNTSLSNIFDRPKDEPKTILWAKEQLIK